MGQHSYLSAVGEEVVVEEAMVQRKVFLLWEEEEEEGDAEGWILPPLQFPSYPVSVGMGGAVGLSAQPGFNTTFGSPALIIAVGGGGGLSQVGGGGIQAPGGPGGIFTLTSHTSQGCFGSAGSGGWHNMTNTLGFAGSGGMAFGSGNPNSAGNLLQQPPTTGTAPGSGGNGTFQIFSGAGNPGGKGGDGSIVVFAYG